MRRMRRAAGSGGARPGFCHWNAPRAQRTALGWIGHHRERFQSGALYAKVRLPSAAVNDGPGREDARAALTEGLDDFARAAAGGNDVFDDYGALARSNLKSPAQRHLP